MKKINKIVGLTMLVSSLFTVAACNTSGTTPINIADSISFSQLKEISLLANGQTEYNVTGKILNIGDNGGIIPCSGTNLCAYYDATTMKYGLKNFLTGQVINDDVSATNILSEGSFVKSYNVYYSTSLPVVVFSSNDSSTGVTTIYYADCYGKVIAEEETNNYKYLSNYRTKHVGNYEYFVINHSDSYTKNMYFRFTYNNNMYVVESISESEYTDPQSQNVNLDNQVEYDDGLTPKYDSKGNIFGYTQSQNSVMFIYDANKHYLNNIDLSSFGFGTYDSVLTLEKKICYFKNETYYENQLNRGSKTTYKCRCLEIDLTNGQVSYNDNFKYYVNNCYTKITDEMFDYCYLTYYDLNDKGELGDVLKCAILKDQLSFGNSFVYDGFTSSVYKVDDNSLLAYFNSGLYYVTERERTLLNGISIMSVFNNGDIVYKNQDNKFYMCNKANIRDAVFNLDGGVTYISSYKYNGKVASYNYDSLTSSYKAGQKVLLSNCLTYAQKGIYITSDSIYILDTLLYKTDVNVTISEISSMGQTGNTIIYVVRLSDDSYKYFMYTKTEV